MTRPADTPMTVAQQRALDKLEKKHRVTAVEVVDGRVHVDLDNTYEPRVSIAPNGLVEPR